jgi:hypothetical protein
MNLKGIMQTLGAQPGQVVSNPYVRAFAPQVETIVKEEEDHEVSMAQNQLDSIIKAATELKGKIGQGEKDIPAWIQDHITNSENYISQAASNYHEYGTNEAGINGADRYPTLNAESVELPATALPSTVKSKLTIAIDTIKDAELTYNQKVQIVKHVTDSLGIDKTEFNKIASRLKGTMESVNEVSYNVKANNAYEFINGAVAVLGGYLRDEKLESGVKNTLQRVVKDLEGLRKYFFSRKDESVNEGRGVKSLAKELFAVAEQIQGYVEVYKKKKGTPDEKKIVDILKKLNAEKKELEKRMEAEVTSLYRDAELQIEGTNTLRLKNVK